ANLEAVVGKGPGHVERGNARGGFGVGILAGERAGGGERQSGGEAESEGKKFHESIQLVFLAISLTMADTASRSFFTSSLVAVVPRGKVTRVCTSSSCLLSETTSASSRALGERSLILPRR